MTHAKTWPVAPANDTDTITSAQLVDIDNKTVSAPDFTNGGSYSPTGEVTIGGANGLGFTGAGLQIKSGGTETIQSGGTLTAASGSTVNLNGTTTVAGPVNLDTGAQSLASTRYRLDITSLGNANGDVLKFKDHYITTATALTANRVHTLRDSGTSGGVSCVPVAGNKVRVTRRDTAAFSITFQTETGSTGLCIFPNSGAASWAEFEFDGTRWRVVAWGGATTNVVV